MGVIDKLAFWRKSRPKANAVSPEALPGTTVPESPTCEATAASPAPAPAPTTAPKPAVVAETEQPQPSGLVQQLTEAAPSSPSRSRITSDADQLEAELCDEVLFPLPELRSSPSASLANIENEELTFDRSLEDVLTRVSQAFGPMIASSLRSPKWDKRAQALKAVGSMLHGLDLQGMAPPGSTGVLGKGLRLGERACAWRVCCQLLHHVMREKVMPVRLAACELFHDAFGNAEGLVSQEECRKALDVLLEHVILWLGDSNVRLHESARKRVLFCAERPFVLGLDSTLVRLKDRLDSCGKGRGGDRQKVHNGVLDTVNFLLQHFPGRRTSSPSVADLDEDADDAAASPASSWIAADIAGFIVAGMEDSLGPRVRSTAVALAVTVYQTFGMETMTPLLDGLRPAKQTLLKQKFQEYEDMETEDFKRNTHCGTTSSTVATPTDGLDIFDAAHCGQSFGKLGGMLPGALENTEEEDLMDDILEETGMVFGGKCIVYENFGHDDRCLRPVPGLSRTLLEEDLEEEHRILEEEIMKLDLDNLTVEEVTK